VQKGGPVREALFVCAETVIDASTWERRGWGRLWQVCGGRGGGRGRLKGFEKEKGKERPRSWIMKRTTRVEVSISRGEGGGHIGTF